jgi:hypothetical protein
LALQVPAKQKEKRWRTTGVLESAASKAVRKMEQHGTS